jgi:hypothetical protein
MDFDTFSARAEAITASFPPDVLEGIESVEVHRDRKPDPFLHGIVRLGECETSPLSWMVGEEAFRSRVHIYYGSFVELAQDPRFDVEGELRETIEHEIRHHLEDRAGIKALRDEDDLFYYHARFRADMEVPAGWYRRGERLAASLWAVDLDLFLELDLRRKEWERLRGTTLEMEVLGEPLEVEIPEDASPDEILTYEGAGLVEGDEEAEEEEEGEEGGGEEEAAAEGAGDLHIVPRVR